MTCKACEDAARREDNCGYSMRAEEIRSSCRHADADAVREAEGCTYVDIAVLRKANVDLATESSMFRHCLSRLLEAVNGMTDMDEQDGPEFFEAESELNLAMENAIRALDRSPLYAKPQETGSGGGQRVPDGYVLVPVEPTEEMCAAGAPHCKNNSFTAMMVYKAMLADKSGEA